MLKSLYRFLQMSCASFLVNFVVTLALHEWAHISAEIAFASALIIVIAMNFVMMRWYIYEGNYSSLWHQIWIYLCSACTFRIAEYGMFLLWHTYYGSDYRVAMIGITAISSAIKFLYYRNLFERRLGPHHVQVLTIKQSTGL